MTERLYYADSYLTRFEATLLDRDASGRRLYLDRSAFYPTSGGQQFDVGSLCLRDGGAPPLQVVDVVDEGERVAHVLAEPAELPSGARLEGSVSFARRFDHMQQHTGQHLLSAVFQELCGHATLSVHFGEASSTLDLDAAALAPEQLAAVEQRANGVVFEDREVGVAVEDAQAATGLRKATARSGALRIVSIAGLDRSACGGTHVRRTGEIGPILLRKLDRVRKSVRVEFVCGGRAIRRARADYGAALHASGLLSTSIDELGAVLEARLGEQQQAQKQLRELRESLDAYRAREMYAQASPASAGAAQICHVERRQTGGLQDLRGLALQFAAQPRGVLVAALEQPPSLLLAAAEDSGIDAAALLRAALTAAGGRGGGTPRLAQGSAPTVSALETALAALGAQLGLGTLNSSR